MPHGMLDFFLQLIDDLVLVPCFARQFLVHLEDGGYQIRVMMSNVGKDEDWKRWKLNWLE